MVEKNEWQNNGGDAPMSFGFPYLNDKWIYQTIFDYLDID